MDYGLSWFASGEELLRRWWRSGTLHSTSVRFTGKSSIDGRIIDEESKISILILDLDLFCMFVLWIKKMKKINFKRGAMFRRSSLIEQITIEISKQNTKNCIWQFCIIKKTMKIVWLKSLQKSLNDLALSANFPVVFFLIF